MKMHSGWSRITRGLIGMVTLLTAFVAISPAQISVPQSGFSNLLTAGYSFYYYQSDSLPSPVNIGTRGGPTTYDFNGLSRQG
jgi:hypothetical protein